MSRLTKEHIYEISRRTASIKKAAQSILEPADAAAATMRELAKGIVSDVEAIDKLILFYGHH